MSETEIQSSEVIACCESGATNAGLRAVCPFREGPETLDLLLAEMGAADIDLLDAALDLRSAMFARDDARACLDQLCRLGTLLDGRHYLAFYRVRCWVRRHLRAEVRAHRAAEWVPVELPCDCSRPEAVANSCLASLEARAEEWAVTGRVRFLFAGEADLVGR